MAVSLLQAARAKQGLTDEQIYGELFSAWLKDVRERSSPDTQKTFRDVAERCIKDGEIHLSKERVGVNMCIALASMLQRANITRLDLYHNAIRDAGCESLAHYLREDKHLLYLNLGGNDIGSQGVQAIAGALGSHPKLATLILGSDFEDTHLNRVDPIAARLLVEKCRASKTLKVLDLGRNPIGHGSQEVFPALQQLILGTNTLQVLKLGDTLMSSESALLLVEALQKNTSVNHLDISSNDLDSSVAHEIGRLVVERAPRSATGGLKVLVAHNNPHFGSAGCQSIFRALGNDKGIQVLGLTRCGVDDMAVQALCTSLATNTTLAELELQCNMITESGAVDIAKALLRHAGLKRLGLGMNRVRDDGVCALASALETNRTLQHLDVSDTWTGDRGLIAMGVALANNSSLATLKMSNNHVSDDGGTAFVALLDRNKSLQNCSLKGNSIFHSTIMHVQKVTSRNRQMRAEEVPNRLKREVIKLHYQMYKLEEAKAELQNQKTEKLKIDKAQEEFEGKFRLEEAEFRKKQKEMLEHIAAADAQTRAAEKELDTIVENFKKEEIAHQGEMVQLKEKYDLEVREREKAETEFKKIQAEIATQEEMKALRVEELRTKIEHAREEREKWSQQTKDYRSQVEAAQKRLQELQSMAGSTGKGAAKGAKKAVKKDKKEKKDPGASDIANLLETQK